MNETQSYIEDDEIDLLELFALFWNHAFMIIAISIAAGITCLLVCKFFVTPRYSASIDLIVNTRQDVNATVTNDNISSAKSLASTYAVVIKSNIVLDEVIETLNLDMTYSQLYDAISVESVDSTQIIKITAVNENPGLAGQIVQTIANLAPDMLVETVEAGSCKIVSKVEIDSKPVSPHTARNAAISMMAALIVSYGVVFILHLLHNYIENDEDVQKQLGLPILGVIPEI